MHCVCQCLNLKRVIMILLNPALDVFALMVQDLMPLITRLHNGSPMGIGTGRAVEACLSQLLGLNPPPTLYSSSTRTSAALASHGKRCRPYYCAPRLGVYIDGADEVASGQDWPVIIKGGGGALYREKYLAQRARYFVCIAQEKKLVSKLGAFGLPLEVKRDIASAQMATIQSIVHCQETDMASAWDQRVPSDNGHWIIRIQGWQPDADLEAQELALEATPSVVCAGIFAVRRPDLCVIGKPSGPSVIIGAA